MTPLEAADAVGALLRHADLTPREVEAVVVLRDHARAAAPARACPSCASTGWVCSVCDHVLDVERAACPAYHPDYGFTCPWLPRDHGGAHFDASGGHWTAQGQVATSPAPEGGDLAELGDELHARWSGVPAGVSVASVGMTVLARWAGTVLGHRCAPAPSVATPPQEGEATQIVGSLCAEYGVAQQELLDAVNRDRVAALALYSDAWTGPGRPCARCVPADPPAEVCTCTTPEPDIDCAEHGDGLREKRANTLWAEGEVPS